LNNNVNCPLCGNPMIYIAEKAFYRCIDECGEFWPTPEYELYKDLFDQEIHYKKSMLKKQGRGGNSSRSKKNYKRKKGKWSRTTCIN